MNVRQSEASHRSVHRQYVRMRVRRDNEASALIDGSGTVNFDPYAKIPVLVSYPRLLFRLLPNACCLMPGYIELNDLNRGQRLNDLNVRYNWNIWNNWNQRFPSRLIREH